MSQGAQFDVDAFLDSLILPGPTVIDIGERTAFTPPGPPPIGPVPALFGPISIGRVEGQFEFTCGEEDLTGPPECATPAYAAANFDWKWGLLEVVSESPLVASFVSSGGNTLFPSDIALDEGVTGITTMGFEGDPFARQMHIAFNIEGEGITLNPGFKYIFFAIVSAIPLPNTVSNSGGAAEGAIYQSAVLDGPPFQFHGYPAFEPTANQFATSRLIPIVPEPSSAVLLGVVLAGFIVRRGKK